LYYYAKKYELNRQSLVDNISTIILVGIVGARLTYAIVNHQELESFWQTFYIWQGGLVSWGGFIAGLITTIILLRSQKQPIKPWMDGFALATLLGVAIGRIGCFLAGDIIGKSTSLFPNGFPVALSESVLVAVMLVGLFIVKMRIRQRNGMIFIESAFGYSIIRLIIDSFRDEPKILFDLSISQIMAVIVALLTLFLILVTIMKSKGRRGQAFPK